jgi:hypothetical protein
MFDFDEGDTGGEKGPYVNWHVKGRDDGAIDGRCFSIKEDEEDIADFTARMKKGVIFNIPALKTGWCFTEGIRGVAPEWAWNPKVSHFETMPDDRDWKKGFSVPIAIGGGKTAVWSQSGAGAFGAIVNLAADLKKESAKNAGLLPKVKFTGEVEAVKFKKGGTSIPELKIAGWTEAPDCFNAASIDTGDGKATEAEVEDTQIDDDEEY